MRLYHVVAVLSKILTDGDAKRWTEVRLEQRGGVRWIAARLETRGVATEPV
jgi:hypothetical protein